MLHLPHSYDRDGYKHTMSLMLPEGDPKKPLPTHMYSHMRAISASMQSRYVTTNLGVLILIGG